MYVTVRVSSYSVEGLPNSSNEPRVRPVRLQPVLVLRERVVPVTLHLSSGSVADTHCVCVCDELSESVCVSPVQVCVRRLS